ncbi:uncharacterized protein LOC130550464 [Triplophysa rosa]|uniref:uncharacterized protein LOC130550464 n=1 Tax=Triplophysa rosa TaxID=992332 RepID=UPI002545D70E|nr:uncharacterized protein LOC130550464 [Triplophysa rosa]
MDIDLSAVGVSQTLRPTSSFVVGKFVKALEKASTKENLNASQTNGLQNFKPVQFAEIAAVTTDPELSFTEVTASPQTTVYSSELETDPGNQTTPTAESIIPFYEGILIPNTTTLVTMTSD